MKTKLTETLVKNLPLNTVIWDAEITGLGIRRQRRDRVFILRRNGLQVTLGEWPILSVKDARDAAIDRLRGNKAVGGAVRFKDAVDDYLAVGQWRSRREIERHLLEDCRPLADRRFGEINRAALASLLAEIEKRGAVTRNRVRASLSALWSYAIAEGLCENNPVQGTRRAEERPRDRVLTRDEIAALWRGLPPTRFGDIVRLLLLTGQRRSEIADLRRDEIILDAEPRIVLSAARTKSDRAHIVPLAPQAIAILQPYLANGEALFDGFASFSNRKGALDATLGIAHYRIHDLRRSCASWIAELGFGTPWTVEAILNHRKPGIMSVYNKATYAKEMRSALTQWAEWIGGL
jgi:integrase